MIRRRAGRTARLGPDMVADWVTVGAGGASRGLPVPTPAARSVDRDASIRGSTSAGDDRWALLGPDRRAERRPKRLPVFAGCVEILYVMKQHECDKYSIYYIKNGTKTLYCSSA